MKWLLIMKIVSVSSIYMPDSYIRGGTYGGGGDVRGFRADVKVESISTQILDSKELCKKTGKTSGFSFECREIK